MGLLLMIGMLAMILDSRTALQGASQGVELCLTAVIPSLLPFLCLSMALTQRLFSKRLPLFGVIGRLFGIPKGAEILLLPALLGGYPAGAACIAQAANRGALQKRDAEILLGFCSLPGPAFLFGLVARQFSNGWAGAALWALVLLSAWAVSRILPARSERATVEPAASADPITQAGAAMGKICITVILFRVGLNFLRTYLPLDGIALVAAEGLLELTNGCCHLQSVPSEPARFLLAGGLTAFGGVCVGLQTAQVCPGLSLRDYWLGKALQAVFVLLFGWLLLRKQVVLMAILIAALIFLPGKVAFWRHRVYNGLKQPSGRKLCFSERK